MRFRACSPRGRRGVAAGQDCGGGARGHRTRARSIAGAAAALRAGLAGARSEGVARAGPLIATLAPAGIAAQALQAIRQWVCGRTVAPLTAAVFETFVLRPERRRTCAESCRGFATSCAKSLHAAAVAAGASAALCGTGAGHWRRCCLRIFCRTTPYAQLAAFSALPEGDEITGGPLAAKSREGCGAGGATGAVTPRRMKLPRREPRRSVSLAGGGVSRELVRAGTRHGGAGVGRETGPRARGKASRCGNGHWACRAAAADCHGDGACDQSHGAEESGRPRPAV
jgi:hypothetical protein